MAEAVPLRQGRVPPRLPPSRRLDSRTPWEGAWTRGRSGNGACSAPSLSGSPCWSPYQPPPVQPRALFCAAYAVVDRMGGHPTLCAKGIKPPSTTKRHPAMITTRPGRRPRPACGRSCGAPPGTACRGRSRPRARHRSRLGGGAAGRRPRRGRPGRRSGRGAAGRRDFGGRSASTARRSSVIVTRWQAAEILLARLPGTT